ncbi:unnamed protein product, partial [Adineta steineri]
YCANEFWLAIYTLITATILPSIINIILNTLIFSHVRSSSLRVHPNTVKAVANTVKNQQPVINRRDISLLRQMVFMFVMFIGGWIPALILNILNQTMNFDFKIVQIAIIFSQLCLLGILINLFMYNHELRQYLSNKIRIFLQR